MRIQAVDDDAQMHFDGELSPVINTTLQCVMECSKLQWLN